jgi:hypothetical protein
MFVDMLVAPHPDLHETEAIGDRTSRGASSGRRGHSSVHNLAHMAMPPRGFGRIWPGMIVAARVAMRRTSNVLWSALALMSALAAVRCGGSTGSSSHGGSSGSSSTAGNSTGSSSSGGTSTGSTMASSSGGDAGATCATCDKAHACCVALTDGGAACDDNYSSSTCELAPSPADQAAYIGFCETEIQTGKAQNVAACD